MSDGNMAAERDNIDITVIITAYNRKQFLKDAVKSVINQDFEKDHLEIVIVRNFVFDEDIEIIKSSNVRYKLIVEDLAVGKALEKAINVSSGKILCFLDDDDLFLPGKLKWVDAEFRTVEKLVCLHNNFIVKDLSAGKEVIPMQFEEFTISLVKIKSFSQLLNSFKKIHEINGGFNLSCFSIKKMHVAKYLDLLSDVTNTTDGVILYLSLLTGDLVRFSSVVLNSYRFHFIESTHSEYKWSEFAKKATQANRKYNDLTSILKAISPNNFLYKIVQADAAYWKIHSNNLSLNNNISAKEIFKFLTGEWPISSLRVKEFLYFLITKLMPFRYVLEILSQNVP